MDWFTRALDDSMTPNQRLIMESEVEWEKARLDQRMAAGSERVNDWIITASADDMDAADQRRHQVMDSMSDLSAQDWRWLGEALEEAERRILRERGITPHE